MAELSYIRALNQALAGEMRRDQRVIVIGEDVAEGGPYGATRDLAAELGERRVIDTPISEAAVTGVAVGAALSGWRPVVEIMFIDFITLALHQLVNHAAEARYNSGGQLRVPLVLRTHGGARVRSGAQHSQSLQAWLAHVPGLAVVMPATPTDSAGLLRAAIRADDPVVVVENKALYYEKGEVADGALVPIGAAVTRRDGRDVTVVATSRLVGEALAAVDELAAEGVSVEVIDPRTINPLDRETILRSVSRTTRLVVAHEAATIGGVGAGGAAGVPRAAAQPARGRGCPAPAP